MAKVFIIAEAGVNHNGSLKTAKRLVDVAVMAGADAIKFQTFNAHSLVSKFAPKAMYQVKTTGRDESQLEMIKKLELSRNDHKELIKYCRSKKLMFISSPFDLESIDFLARLGLRILKIPSGEITNLPYLRKIGSLRKKIIMSTGMATLAEIEDALNVLVKRGTRKKDIVVLHCNTEYPTPFKDVNLLAMLTIKKVLGVDIGYSDHTRGIEAAIAATALGAVVIEKHFTLDRKMPGPDHRASLEPDELKRMVNAIRNVEEAMGSGVKRASTSEKDNIGVVRKSIVARVNIKKGEHFTERNLAAKRPGIGVSPMQWYVVLGRVAKKDFYQDELISI
ncbi:MAG: N-acetylneuraminate synthase [Candidatus Omnitrophica bacterium]|nr:N-acetylneuraminate synthase [Candidatus Omnitrophota bacterium]